MKYEKESPRLTVRFIDADSEIELFSIERNWTNVGEIFTNHIASSLIQQQFKNKKSPKRIMVMIAEDFELIEE